MLVLALGILTVATISDVAAHSTEPLASISNKGQLARLEDGTRILCRSAEPGAESFETEWGLFRCPGNPVVDVINADAEWKALEALRAYNTDAFLQQASKRGFLQPLMDAAKWKGKKADSIDQEALLRNIESWGPYFDPLPSKIAVKDRVEFLWDKLQSSDIGEAALLTGRLLAELDRGAHMRADQKISLADLRRALRSKNPEIRRASALVSQRQMEMQIWSPLLKSSIEDDLASVRAACASSVMAMDSEKALSGFSSALWRSRSDKKRIAAAEHLGQHGDALSIDVLMVPLRASTVTGGPASAFAHFGRQVSVVADFDVEIAQAASIADPRVIVLQEGVALQVRVVSTHLARTVMMSLKKISHSNPGPRPEDWLRWYEER